MNSLQTQLQSTKRSLSSTKESLAEEKSTLEGKLAETQQQLKEARTENESNKVSITVVTPQCYERASMMFNHHQATSTFHYLKFICATLQV